MTTGVVACYNLLYFHVKLIYFLSWAGSVPRTVPAASSEMANRAPLGRGNTSSQPRTRYAPSRSGRREGHPPRSVANGPRMIRSHPPLPANAPCSNIGAVPVAPVVVGLRFGNTRQHRRDGLLAVGGLDPVPVIDVERRRPVRRRQKDGHCVKNTECTPQYQSRASRIDRYTRITHPAAMCTGRPQSPT